MQLRVKPACVVLMALCFSVASPVTGTPVHTLPETADPSAGDDGNHSANAGGGAFPLLGDANLDSTVDLMDMDILGQNYGLAGGAAWADGDFDSDGRVGLADLDILGSNYGAWSSGADTPIRSDLPEPLTAVGLLVSIGSLGAYIRRRRVA